MQTFWNTRFTKRDYEATNIVAIKADRLPVGYDPTIWRADADISARLRSPVQQIDIIHQNGECFTRLGYL